MPHHLPTRLNTDNVDGVKGGLLEELRSYVISGRFVIRMNVYSVDERTQGV
jgi:hypothetical protein